MSPAPHHPAVALARPAASIDATADLPGGTAWEPKWDGARVLATADGAATTLRSRDGGDVTLGFPEVVAAVAAQVPAGTVLDGEVVVWRSGRLDHLAVQRRRPVPRSVEYVARHEPAQLIAFDVLRQHGTDLRDAPFLDRRMALEELAASWSRGPEAPLTLSPLTGDRDLAARWFRDLAITGVEGLVAKGLEQPYGGGRRDWRKVRHHGTVDLVATAVTGPLAQPDAVLLALPVDGALVPVGRTLPLSQVAGIGLGRHLVPLPAGDDGSPGGTGAGRRSRVPAPVPAGSAATPVVPVVVEVSATVAWARDALARPAQYVRSRPDLDVAEVDPEQAYRGGARPLPGGATAPLP